MAAAAAASPTEPGTSLSLPSPPPPPCAPCAPTARREKEKGVITGAAVRYRTDDRVGGVSAMQVGCAVQVGLGGTAVLMIVCWPEGGRGAPKG